MKAVGAAATAGAASGVAFAADAWGMRVRASTPAIPAAADAVQILRRFFERWVRMWGAFRSGTKRQLRSFT
ncbi:hypothetical protein GCM10009612_64810 [Streptomyces beijiangensis]